MAYKHCRLPPIPIATPDPMNTTNTPSFRNVEGFPDDPPIEHAAAFTAEMDRRRSVQRLMRLVLRPLVSCMPEAQVNPAKPRQTPPNPANPDFHLSPPCVLNKSAPADERASTHRHVLPA